MGPGVVACDRDAGGGFRAGADRGAAHRSEFPGLVCLQPHPPADPVSAVAVPISCATTTQEPYDSFVDSFVDSFAGRLCEVPRDALRRLRHNPNTGETY